MNFKIKDITLFFFCLLVYINPFLSGDIFSVLSFLLLVAYLVIINFKFPNYPSVGTLSLLLIFGIGFFHGVLNGLNRDFLRDIWIFFKPIYLIYFGSILAAIYIGSERKVLQIIVIAGLISAMYHFVEIVSVPKFWKIPLHTIRDVTRRASLIEALSLGLLLYALIKKEIYIFKKRYLLVFGSLILISILLFVSRTMFLILFIYCGFFFNYFKFSIKATVIALVVVCLLGFIFSLPKQSQDTSIGRLISKIQKSPSELLFSDDDANNKQSINEYWRGYEAFRAISQTIKNGPLAITFGNGFGSLVDLKIIMRLGNTDFRYVPKIHDGYAQLFFKTGIVSVILYATFLFFFYTSAVKVVTNDKNLITFKKIILGSLITLLLTTSTISGIYNDSSLDSVLLLMVFCYVLLRNNAKRNFLSQDEF